MKYNVLKSVDDVLAFPNKDWREVDAAAEHIPVITDLVDAQANLALVIRKVGLGDNIDSKTLFDALQDVFTKIDGAKCFIRDTFKSH